MISPKVLIVSLFCIAIIAFAFLSRPAVPFCERYEAKTIFTPQGIYVVIDMANMEKLAAMVQGLSKGTCRFPE